MMTALAMEQATPRVPPEPVGKLLGGLTLRERQVAELVARGFANKAIGETLSISRWTVAAHLRRIYTRLGVSTRAQMVAVLLLDGALLPPQR